MSSHSIKSTLIRFAVLSTFLSVFSYPCFAIYNPIPIMDEASDMVATASGIVSDLGSLSTELGIDAQIIEEGARLAADVSEIEGLARETGFDIQDLEETYPEITRVKNVGTTIRAVTQIARTSTKLGKLALRLATKAKLAQIENAEVNKEILLTLTKMDQREQKEQLEKAKKDLLEIKKEQDKIKLYHQELKRKGAKTYGNTGLFTFPHGKDVTEKAISATSGLRDVLGGLVLIAFLVRVAFFQFGFRSSGDYGSLISKTIICALLLHYYPEILRAIDQAAELCNRTFGKTAGLREVSESFQASKEAWTSQMKKQLGPSTLSFLSWQVIIEGLKYLLFLITDFLFNMGKAIVVLMLPMIIFLGQMFSFSLAWGFLLGVFFILSIWPLCWNLLVELSLTLWKEQSSVSDYIYSAVFGLLQVFIPGAFIAVLKGHLSPAGQETRMAATSTIANAVGFARGTSGSMSQPPQTGRIGYALSYGTNQLAARTMAALSAAKQGLGGTEAGHSLGEEKPQFEPSRIGRGLRASKSAVKAAALNDHFPDQNTSENHQDGSTAKRLANGLKRRNVRK